MRPTAFNSESAERYSEEGTRNVADITLPDGWPTMRRFRETGVFVLRDQQARFDLAKKKEKIDPPIDSPQIPSGAAPERLRGNERRWISDSFPWECLLLRHG